MAYSLLVPALAFIFLSHVMFHNSHLFCSSCLYIKSSKISHLFCSYNRISFLDGCKCKRINCLKQFSTLCLSISFSVLNWLNQVINFFGKSLLIIKERNKEK